MDEARLVRKFLDAGVNVAPDALEVLSGRADAESAAEMVLSALGGMPDKPPVITKEIVMEILEPGPRPKAQEIARPRGPAPEEGARPPITGEALPELRRRKFKPKAMDVEPRIEVLRDVTGRSRSRGDIKGFARLFADRYERLSGILRRRADFHDAVPIGSLRGDGGRAKIVGMVAEKRETPGGHVALVVEDPTGQAVAWVFKGNRELMQKAAEVVTDEVIGIEADVRSGDSGARLIVRDIVWPDLPASQGPTPVEDPVCAALISDLHVGSEMFLEDAFLRFLRWLGGELGNGAQRELAGRVKYLIIAGDVVDGVGIYPRQEEELLISDIFGQYDAAVELLSHVPEHVAVIISPGNHDAVRTCEPQPALSRDVAKGFYDLNFTMVGNPCLISLHGVKFLIYHGRGFDDLVAAVPGLDRQRPTACMIKLLQKRHLAPIYGGHAAVAPEDRDYLVIEDAPDVFHCGHAHVYGCERYRNTAVLNSGTFQEITLYMRSLGIRPTPGIIPIVDLQTLDTKVMRFA